MAGPLVTRGYVAPATAGGGGGGSSDLRLPFELRDFDGALTAGVDLSGAGVVQISQNGDAFVNRVGAAPTSIGDGLYYYEPDTSEVGSNRWISVKIEHGSYQKSVPIYWMDTVTTADLSAALTTIGNNITAAKNDVIAEVATVPGDVWDETRASHVDAGSFGEGVVVDSLATAALTAVRDAVMTYAFRSGRTVLGFVRRMDALFFGKNTGLRTTGTVTSYQPGGVTPEFTAAQNTTTGVRNEADVTTSDAIDVSYLGAYLGTASGGSGGVDPPVVTAISPTPDTAPGDAGGFAARRSDAIVTPIVIEIEDTDSELSYVCVTLRTYQDDDTEGHVEQVVYRNGSFREPFAGSSSQSLVGDALTLTLQRDDGWTGLGLLLTVDAVDADNNSATEIFTYQLPEAFESAVVSTVPDGERDHVAEALDRLPWQFRGEDG